MENKSRNFSLQVIMYLSFFAMVAVNALANILPFNGMNTGEISNLYNVLFTPAGYVFSIWGIIYIAVFIWLVNLSLNKEPIRKISASLFILSCLLNGSWIFFWHYQFVGTSVFVITALFVTLLLLYLYERGQKGLVWTFSIYLGWVTVATLANISYYLVAEQQISMSSQEVSASLFLLLGLVIGALMLWIYQDRIFNLVFIWAYLGIFFRDYDSSRLVSLIALFSGISLILLIGISFLKRGKNLSKIK